tara:strand:+ start:57 stop:824 length:768 start_codon:yes stop_codon:yes gene_type:complete
MSIVRHGVELLLKQLAKRKANPDVTKGGRWPDRDRTPAGRGEQPTVPERGAIPKGPTPHLTEKEGLESLKKIREGKNWYMDPKTSEVFEFRYGAGVEPRGFYSRYSNVPKYVERAQNELFEEARAEAAGKAFRIKREAEALKRIRTEAPNSSLTAQINKGTGDLDQIFFNVRFNEMNNMAQKAGYPSWQKHMYALRAGANTPADEVALKMYKETMEELAPLTNSAKVMGKTPIPKEFLRYNKGGPVKLMRMKHGY